jgi:hypothetical protein
VSAELGKVKNPGTAALADRFAKNVPQK